MISDAVTLFEVAANSQDSERVQRFRPVRVSNWWTNGSAELSTLQKERISMRLAEPIVLTSVARPPYIDNMQVYFSYIHAMHRESLNPSSQTMLSQCRVLNRFI